MFEFVGSTGAGLNVPQAPWTSMKEAAFGSKRSLRLAESKRPPRDSNPSCLRTPHRRKVEGVLIVGVGEPCVKKNYFAAVRLREPKRPQRHSPPCCRLRAKGESPQVVKADRREYLY